MTRAVSSEYPKTLRRQAVDIEALQLGLDLHTAKTNALAEAFAAERRQWHAKEFVARAEQFSELGAQPDELGQQLQWLYEVDPSQAKEHYAYFEQLLDAATNDLWSARGSSGADVLRLDPEDPFLAKVEEIRSQRFTDRPYAEGFSAAFAEASIQYPALAWKYAMSLRTRTVFG